MPSTASAHYVARAPCADTALAAEDSVAATCAAAVFAAAACATTVFAAEASAAKACAAAASAVAAFATEDSNAKACAAAASAVEALAAEAFAAEASAAEAKTDAAAGTAGCERGRAAEPTARHHCVLRAGARRQLCSVCIDRFVCSPRSVQFVEEMVLGLVSRALHVLRSLVEQSRH